MTPKKRDGIGTDEQEDLLSEVSETGQQSKAFTMMRSVYYLAIATLVLSIVAAQDCKDFHENCQTFAASGECDKNPGFMNANCQKSCDNCPECVDPHLLELGPERVILEVAMPGGSDVQEIELGFYPNAAPLTVAHIVKLFREGCFDTNHIFRVDKGFVAQIQSVNPSNVRKQLSQTCLEESKKNVPGEFTVIPHQRGILSMGRHADPNSGGSSFSMLLGNAPHLDNQYTVFGKVLRGDDVLKELEKVETRKEGMFVMPIERIEISHARVIDTETEKKL